MSGPRAAAAVPTCFPVIRIRKTDLADLDALNAIIAPEAEAMGLAVVRVAFFGGDSDPTLQVMAERPETRQLTIDDCAGLSRRISDKLDALEEADRKSTRLNSKH